MGIFLAFDFCTHSIIPRHLKSGVPPWAGIKMLYLVEDHLGTLKWQDPKVCLAADFESVTAK